MRDRERAILELLQNGSKLRGLDMVNARADVLSRATVYPALDDMERRGLVGSEEIRPAPGLPRRRYWITTQGRMALVIDP